MGINDPIHVLKVSGSNFTREHLLEQMARHEGEHVLEVEVERVDSPDLLENVSRVAEEEDWALRLRAGGTP